MACAGSRPTPATQASKPTSKRSRQAETASDIPSAPHFAPSPSQGKRRKRQKGKSQGSKIDSLCRKALREMLKRTNNHYCPWNQKIKKYPGPATWMKRHDKVCQLLAHTAQSAQAAWLFAG